MVHSSASWVHPCLFVLTAALPRKKLTQLRRLLEHRAGEDWLRGCRVIWVGGAALPQDLAECCRRLELPLSPCYGSSETGAMVTALAPQRFLAGESGCGTALPHAQLRIDPASGAVQVRAASLALGEHAAGRFQPLPLDEGWWSSGDLGRWGGAGGLELLGRCDGAINSGGETVFPEQVELRLLAAAREAGLPLRHLLLLAEPDPLWGERLVALVRAERSAPSVVGASDGGPLGAPDASVCAPIGTTNSAPDGASDDASDGAPAGAPAGAHDVALIGAPDASDGPPDHAHAALIPPPNHPRRRASPQPAAAAVAGLPRAGPLAPGQMATRALARLAAAAAGGELRLALRVRSWAGLGDSVGGAHPRFCKPLHPALTCQQGVTELPQGAIPAAAAQDPVGLAAQARGCIGRGDQ